jgi:hypothetical protein
MSKIFETENDLYNEEVTVKAFCDKFNINYGKQAHFDIDFFISKDGKQIGEVEVKCYNVPHDKYPTQILSSRKYLTMMARCFAFARTDEREYRPILLCRYSDGEILYCNFRTIIGKIEFPQIGGRKPREGAVNDIEWVVRIPKKFFKKL